MRNAKVTFTLDAGGQRTLRVDSGGHISQRRYFFRDGRFGHRKALQAVGRRFLVLLGTASGRGQAFQRKARLLT